MIARNSRRAQAFADALEHLREPHDRLVKELVRTSETITEAADSEPEQQFVQNLRCQLMGQAATNLTSKDSSPQPDRRAISAAATGPRQPRRRLAVLITASLFAVAGAGTIGSSTQAMPGDVLYPVKLQVESVQSSFHQSAQSKGEHELDLALKRLDEVTALTAEDADPTLLSQTLDRFTADAGDGAEHLLETDDSDSHAVSKVDEFTHESQKKLAALRTSIPDGAFDAYRDAEATLDAVTAEISTLCADCDRESISSLRSSVSDTAKNNPDDPPAKPTPSVEPTPDEPEHTQPTPEPVESDDPPETEDQPDDDDVGSDDSSESPRESSDDNRQGLLDPVVGLLDGLLD